MKDDNMTEDEGEVKAEPVEAPTSVEEAVAKERANIAKQLNAIVSRASSANPLAEPIKSIIRKLEA